MNISVIGTGYVGLVTGVCLADLGMNVVCMDNNQEKIDILNKGQCTIYEPNLEEMLKESLNNKRIKFTKKIKEAVEFGQVIFIAVGTPELDDGSADLQYVFEAARDIAFNMNDYKVIVNKSTVPISTGQKVKQEINDILKQLNKNIKFDIVSNPEFLREGSAVGDFINPDRIVIGAENENAITIMKKIYHIQEKINIPIVFTNIETAEMIKYASNAFLATKVSFINEVANMCERSNADVRTVSKAMGLDRRIGPHFLKAGPGYGGSCFPKDTKAFVNIGKRFGYVPKIVKSTIHVNNKQKKIMVDKISRLIGDLEGKTISILGIAFKSETDDIRESPSISIIEELVKGKANVKVYDPKSMDNLKRLQPELRIQYCSDAYLACENSDCVVLVTDWNEFKKFDLIKLKEIVKSPVLVDLRNIYDPEYVKSLGFIYEGVGIR